MGYLELAMAIIFELLGTTFLKLSDGFTVIKPSIISICAYIACYFFFGRCSKKLKLAVAYATWCAVGLVATALISVFYFKEPMDIQSVFGLGLLCIGVCMTNLNSKDN